MNFGKSYFVVLAIGASLLAVPGLNGVARAQTSSPPIDSPEMQALIKNPAMQKAITAARRGDARAAAGYFQDAARQGNPLAQLTLGSMYFEGHGVPKDNIKALTWLKAVLVKNREPTRSMATEILHDISTSLRGSTNPQDRQLGIIAAALPLTALLPQNPRGHQAASPSGNTGGVEGLGDYVARRAFNELTDHAYENPITNPGDFPLTNSGD